VSVRLPRIIVVPLRRAWPWRRDMALLEIGCRQGWRLPAGEVITDVAEALATTMQVQPATAVLAFEGYTLVGACWCCDGPMSDAGTVGLHGPFVMPHAAGNGLALQMQQRLANAKD